MNKDYYKILGIEKTATDDDIKKGYRKMAMKFHPDKNDSPDASERFKEVAEAYEILIDKKKRNDYDQSFSNLSGGEGSGGDSRNHFQYPPYSFKCDPVKIFNQFFGNDNINNNANPFPFSQQFFFNKEDIGMNNSFEQNSNHSGSFTKIWRHSQTQWNPSFEQPSSANSQHHPSNLHRTSYQTQTQRQQQQQQQQQQRQYSLFPEGRKKNPPITVNIFVTLNDILSGKTIDKNVTCKVLNENGHVTERVKSFTIDVNPGCVNGAKITFREMGDEFPSDVIFVIKEKPHLYFKRINSDLIYTSRISLKTALCGGGVIGVPTLDGPTIPVPLHLGAEVITPKTEKIIISKGLPCTEKPLMRGNLIIKFDIQFPLALSDASKKELLGIL
ncbi:Fibrillin-2 [Armadillidium vulgare]|nr:Major facilitator superfamily domain-containing protein 12 [Armadillidium vulgare]RXG59947.1 Fibrillin-2 [Armadillidium vulgare]